VLHLLNGSVDGPQSWSGRFGEQKNLLTLKDLLTLQNVLQPQKGTVTRNLHWLYLTRKKSC